MNFILCLQEQFLFLGFCLLGRFIYGPGSLFLSCPEFTLGDYFSGIIACSQAYCQ